MLYLFTTCSLFYLCTAFAYALDVDIDLPDDICTVKHTHRARDAKRTVLFIQDIHTSYNAQQHLVEILELLSQKYNIQLIGVEGASGNIDVSDLAAFPDKDVTRQVIEYFFKTGEVHGSECFAILNDMRHESPVDLFGVEDTFLYKRNLNSYLCALNTQQQLTQCVSVLNEAINSLKSNIYSKELYSFDQMVASSSPDVSYIKKLVEKAQVCLLPYTDKTTINLLISLENRERAIQVEAVEADTKNLIAQLKNVLSKNDLNRLAQNELLHGLHTISTLEYLSTIDQLCHENKIETDGYPHFKEYYEYLTAFESINYDTLAAEIKSLENDVYDLLLETPEQRKLYAITKYVGCLDSFSKLHMTRSLLEEYNASGLSLTDVMDFFKIHCPGITFSLSIFSDIELTIAYYEEFYDLVLERDTCMVDNLLAKMDSKKQSCAVLIAGGFHNEGIEDILKARGVSFVTLLPADDNQSDTVPYAQLLKNVQTPLDTFFTAGTSTLKVASWLADVPLVFPERKTALVAKIKTLLVTTKLFTLYKEHIEDHPLRPEDYIVPDDINEKLLSTMNSIIAKAGFSDFMKMLTVTARADNIYTEIAFGETDQFEDKLVIRLTDNKPEHHVGLATTNNIIETVQLSTGLIADFLDYNAYNNIKLYENKVLAVLIKHLSNQAATSYDLETVLRNTLELQLAYGEMQHYIDYLLDARILIKEDNLYRLPDSLVNDTACLVADKILESYKQDPQFPPMLTIDMQSLPDALAHHFSQDDSQVASIMIHSNLPIAKVIVTLMSILDAGAQMPDQLEINGLKLKTYELPNSMKLVYVSEAIQPVNIFESVTRFPQTQIEFSSLPMIPVVPIRQDELKTSVNDLVIMAQNGDAKAETELIQMHEGLITWLANKMRYVIDSNVSKGNISNFDDLKSQASEGFWRAIHSYSQGRGAKFSSYAVVCMRNEVNKSIAGASWLKASGHKRIKLYYQAKSLLMDRLDRDPSEEEIAIYLGCSVEDIKHTLKLSKQHMVSIDAPIARDDSDGSPLLDLIKDSSAKTPEDQVIAQERKALLMFAISLFDYRTQEILNMYIAGHTYEEITDVVGLTRQRINQIIKDEAFTKMTYIIQLYNILGKSKLVAFGKEIETAINQLSFREKEVVYLACTTTLTDELISQRLNFSDVVSFRNYKKEIIDRLEAKLFSKDDYADLPKLLKRRSLRWTMFINNILPERESFMLEAMKSLFRRTSEYPVSETTLDEVLYDYDKLFSPMEYQHILMTQYEGLRIKEAGEVLDIPMLNSSYVNIRIRNKLHAIVDVRTAFSNEDRNDLAEYLLDAINKMPVRDRKVYIGLYFDRVTMATVAESLSINESVVKNIRKNVLEHLKRYIRMNIDDSAMRRKINSNFNIDSEYQLEQFLRGITQDIKRENILLKQEEPEDVAEVFEAILHKQGDVPIYEELRQGLQIYKRFVHQSHIDFFVAYYVNEYSSSDAADMLGIKKANFDPRLYGEMIPALKRFAEFYTSFTVLERKELCMQAADIINQLSPLRKAMIIHFFYDGLSYDEIADILNLDTKNNYHRNRIVRTVKEVGKTFVEGFPSQELVDRFTPNPRSNIMYMNYFLSGLKHQVPRDFFDVPLPPSSLVVTYDSEDVIQDFYGDTMINNIFKFIDQKPQDELSLRLMSSVLDRLQPQQINVLYYRFGKSMTRNEAAAEMKLRLHGVTSAQRTAMKNVKDYFGFLSQFSKDDLVYLHNLLAESLESGQISPDYRKILIHIFYDNMPIKYAIRAVLSTKSAGKNIYPKTTAMKYLCEAFFAKLDKDKYPQFAELSEKNFDSLLYSLKATIPRERFAVPESPEGRNNTSLKNLFPEEEIIELPAKPEDDATEELHWILLPSEVNRLFQLLDTDSIDELKYYLAQTATHVTSRPQPVFIDRNPLFAKLRRMNLSAMDVRQYLLDSFTPMGLSFIEVVQLQTVLERSHYLQCDIQDKDVIVLDLDSLSIYDELPYENIKERKKIARYIEDLQENYRLNGRTASFVLFSRKYSMAQLESLLGRELLSFFRTHDNWLISKDLYIQFEQNSKNKANDFFTLLLRDYSVRPVNIKLFSNHDSIANAAKKAGCIVADRRSDIYQAISIFAGIHPTHSRNFRLDKKGLSVAMFLNNRSDGYLGFSGQEICLHDELLAKKKEINTSHFIEQSL